MKSPITGKDMQLHRENRELTYRKEQFPVVFHFYRCADSGAEFTNDELGELNLLQVYNQYRAKHNLPFPEEVSQIRKKYNLSATKMSEILGFGINSYGNYERGEVPSLSNAKMIQVAANTRQFAELVKLADSLDEQFRQKLLKRLTVLQTEEKAARWIAKLDAYILHSSQPDIFSGFRKPSMDRIAAMVLYFADRLQPWKTQLNKLLFYADFLHFKRHCFSISGLQYRAIPMGPVPYNYGSLFEYLTNKKVIDIQRVEFDPHKIGEQFKAAAGQTFAAELFKEEELAVLETVYRSFSGLSTKEIVNVSHQEKAWQENQQERQLISYEFAFELQALNE